MLSDLGDSGSIEQDADHVLMLYRQGYYDEDCENPTLTDIYVCENRDGPTGHCELEFDTDERSFGRSRRPDDRLARHRLPESAKFRPAAARGELWEVDGTGHSYGLRKIRFSNNRSEAPAASNRNRRIAIPHVVNSTTSMTARE